jgi:uncharacterized SAM-binding protein YcdF (DUF218 family)
VAPGDVVEEELAAATIENGLFAARMFDARGWPKTAAIVSQPFHLPGTCGNCKQQGSQVRNAAAVDARSASDFAPVLDLKADPVAEAKRFDLIVVHEPYASTDTMQRPTPQLARRLRIAAALYHEKVAPNLLLYSDRYTRGPVGHQSILSEG